MFFPLRVKNGGVRETLAAVQLVKVLIMLSTETDQRHLIAAPTLITRWASVYRQFRILCLKVPPNF